MPRRSATPSPISRAPDPPSPATASSTTTAQPHFAPPTPITLVSSRIPPPLLFTEDASSSPSITFSNFIHSYCQCGYHRRSALAPTSFPPARTGEATTPPVLTGKCAANPLPLFRSRCPATTICHYKGATIVHPPRGSVRHPLHRAQNVTPFRPVGSPHAPPRRPTTATARRSSEHPPHDELTRYSTHLSVSRRPPPSHSVPSPTRPPLHSSHIPRRRAIDIPTTGDHPKTTHLTVRYRILVTDHSLPSITIWISSATTCSHLHSKPPCPVGSPPAGIPSPTSLRRPYAVGDLIILTPSFLWSNGHSISRRRLTLDHH